jgi:hypothetical protein
MKNKNTACREDLPHSRPPYIAQKSVLEKVLTANEISFPLTPLYDPAPD